MQRHPDSAVPNAAFRASVALSICSKKSRLEDFELSDDESVLRRGSSRGSEFSSDEAKQEKSEPKR